MNLLFTALGRRLADYAGKAVVGISQTTNAEKRESAA
jgi:hypothetical protein